MKLLLELFLIFAKMGAVTFGGGYAMLPILQREIVENKHWGSEEELMDVVESAILLFRDEGISGERFADTIERLGFDYLNDKLINHKIDKAAALQKTVKGGATC